MIQSVKKLVVSGFVLGFMCMPLFIHAQGNSSGNGGPGNTTSGSSGSGGPNSSVVIKIENPLFEKSADSIPAVLGIVFNNIVLPIGAMVAVIYIMYAGFLMVTAQGSQKQIDEAKSAFFNAAIGTAILLGAWAISQAIATTINNIVAP